MWIFVLNFNIFYIKSIALPIQQENTPVEENPCSSHTACLEPLQSINVNFKKELTDFLTKTHFNCTTNSKLCGKNEEYEVCIEQKTLFL